MLITYCLNKSVQRYRIRKPELLPHVQNHRKIHLHTNAILLTFQFLYQKSILVSLME
jgi:hypothetical protein